MATTPSILIAERLPTWGRPPASASAAIRATGPSRRRAPPADRMRIMQIRHEETAALTAGVVKMSPAVQPLHDQLDRY